MKQNYSMLFAALAVSGMCAFNAQAETKEATLTVDFEDLEIGYKCFTNGGAGNAEMLIEEDGFNGGQGHVIHVTRPNWDTYTRVHTITCPKGFTLGNCTMIEVNYYNPSDEPTPLDIIIKANAEWYPATLSNTLQWEDVESGEWGMAIFAPDEFEYEDAATAKLSTFDMSIGFFTNPTDYYIGDITFYFEKEVTQREIDEDALDKATAPCVEVNFDNWEVSGEVDGVFSSPHVGSNGGGVNRPDMIIDKGPEGYDNNCVHIIYQGWTQIFLTDAIVAPEGYTCDDIRLIEYDIYETDTPGVDHTQPDNLNANRNGAPHLKLKESYAWGWHPLDNGGSFGTAQLPTVNEWHHVEFYPSAFVFAGRTFEQNKLDAEGQPIDTGEVDDNGNPIYEKETITWDAEQTQDEFGKLKQFWMSVGFFPCCCQTYVDNVKVWFQKTTAGIENIIADKAELESNTATVYNLQGVCVLKNAPKDAVSNLPAGLYIVNGKKVVIK